MLKPRTATFVLQGSSIFRQTAIVQHALMGGTPAVTPPAEQTQARTVIYVLQGSITVRQIPLVNHVLVVSLPLVQGLSQNQIVVVVLLGSLGKSLLPPATTRRAEILKLTHVNNVLLVSM